MFDKPIQLEPPFYPFFKHRVLMNPLVDDGLHPTIFSSVIDFFRDKEIATPEAREEILEEIPIEPFIFESDEPLRVFSISLPHDQNVGVEQTEQLLIMLSYCQAPVSFEIIASHSSITVQFVSRKSDASQLHNQLKAYFPESTIHQRNDLLSEILAKGKFVLVVDYGLRDEFMRPLVMTKNFNLDSLIALFGVFENLDEDEHALIQILFNGAINPWSESIMRSVTDNEGGAFFEDAPDMVKLAEEKISCPLFGVTMRVLVESKKSERTEQLCQHLSQAFVRISTSKSNTLIPLFTDSYDFDTALDDILFRQSHRMGMLLNSRELANFVHLPSPSVVSYKLERDRKKTKGASKSTEGHELVLGVNEHQGKEKRVSVDSSQRLKHTHIIGATGTGKSTLLLNLIIQDIQHGEGIGVLDPHGDLIDSIISYIPESRAKDVVLIDPGDTEYPIGFNILSAHSEIEKDILSSDLVAVFRRLSATWGDQMNSVFANAILAFLESNVGGTLADLRRFLVEKSYRDAYLKSVTDPNVIYYWQKEYPLMRSNSIGSILTRLDTFLRPKLIRNMVSQKRGLNFESLMDSKKIILVKLSQGLIGTENSYLLGTVIVSKIHQAAMARQAQAKEERSDFFLYIDEFQNFITPSMSSILSGARKYHLGLILAHQDMQQLVKQDSELASSVMSNAGTRICFRIGDVDAKRFENGFSFFDANDLQNLNTGEAIVRIDRPEFDFSLTTESLPAVTMSEKLRKQIIFLSQITYGTPKHIIEALLKKSMEEIVEEARNTIDEPVISKEKLPEKKSISQVEIPKIQEVIPTEQAFSPEKQIKQKEQSEHRYLQTLIKRMAESRGFKTLIEEPTPDGKGRVDVSLERNGKKIACEICVTTELEWEVHNIEKCLAAGYEIVIECSNNKKTLENIRRKIEKSLSEVSRSKVHVFDPDSFFLFLDELVAKDASTETRMKGYRIKTEYGVVPDDVSLQKRETVLKSVADSMRKKKK
ncbi:MAG TPA: type IV secretion system DNA-binding domain-containing protein [Chitinophagales bacterium]|nr:type IV secretion system DNA-binding domain-containing protein [Chitinophagales bacterium]